MTNAITRNIRLLQAHNVLHSAIFILPVLIPFYRDSMGLGFKDFIIGEALFAATVLVTEVPSGWLSDVWTRKKVMILGSIIHAIGFACWLFTQTFEQTLIAHVLLGISVSLISGTNSAMLYDSLLVMGQEDKFRRLDGFRHGLGFYAIGLSALAGGFLYELDYRLPMFLTAVSSAGAAVIACFLIEPDRHKRVAEKHPIADMIDTARYALHGHAEVAGIILFAAVLFACTKSVMWTQQPYYELLGLAEKYFGVIAACSLLLAGMAGQFGHYLDGKGGNIRILTIFFVVLCGCALISGLFPGYYAIPLLLVGSPMWGFGAPRIHAAIHKRVGSERRATVLSTLSLMIQLFNIPLFIMMGYVSDLYDIRIALLSLAGIMAVVGVIGGGFIWRKARHVFVL